MININSIPERIINDLHSRGHSNQDIENSTPARLFSEYLAWNGFYGWAEDFTEALDSLRASQEDGGDGE